LLSSEVAQLTSGNRGRRDAAPCKLFLKLLTLGTELSLNVGSLCLAHLLDVLSAVCRCVLCKPCKLLQEPRL